MNPTLFILQAQAAGSAGQGGGNFSFLLMLVAIFAIMYFMMIRPQQKQQKQLRQFRDSITKGTKVVTVGGIHGTVLSVEGNTVLMEIDSNVKIRVDKASLVEAPGNSAPKA